MQLLLIFAVTISIAAVMFAFQNTALITVSFAAWKFEGSLALILIITFGLGIIVSLLFSFSSSFKRFKEMLRLKSQLKEYTDKKDNTNITGQ